MWAARRSCAPTRSRRAACSCRRCNPRRRPAPRAAAGRSEHREPGRHARGRAPRNSTRRRCGSSLPIPTLTRWSRFSCRRWRPAPRTWRARSAGRPRRLEAGAGGVHGCPASVTTARWARPWLSHARAGGDRARARRRSTRSGSRNPSSRPPSLGDVRRDEASAAAGARGAARRRLARRRTTCGDLLGCYGVPVVEQHIVHTADEAGACRQLNSAATSR